MRRLIARLSAIGANPGDGEDTRLRKVLLLVAAITIAPLAMVWGAIYWIGGATMPALMPLAVRSRSRVPSNRWRRSGSSSEPVAS